MTSAGPSAPGSQGGRYASVQANRARFSVAVPSTASFDRLLPAAKAISLAQADQGVILVRNRPESGECRLKSSDGRLPVDLHPTCPLR